ncbi:hypothetical protein L596_019804 [Steinernema carpocapsae]|uniref:Kazal-like domain-containing protein n=1 Tax=Steinernema carpocapsae TaxID=34508 RepID=A0A4U5MRM1_STECR|nr:hypothetical protein L596_019804 [Steinernema carpocapsae]
MGPVCGFLVGSVANKLFFTFPAKAPSGLSPNDPTWIGAWWSGYLVIGLLGITPSLLLCFYPARGDYEESYSKALFIATVSTLNYMAFASKTLFGCTSVVSQIGETGKLTRFNYSNGCNMGCSCEGAQLYPVCDSTGLAYYSPCHAGCRDALVKNAEEHNLEFTNCDCVADGIGSVSKHFCHDDCSNMTILFFVFSAMGALIAGLGMVPGLLVLIRSVPPATRSIALGVHAFVISLLGTLPSPVIWGALIDSACLVWDKTCGKRGTCNIYDTEALRIKMHTIYVMIRIVAMFADGMFPDARCVPSGVTLKTMVHWVARQRRISKI